jgi:hypothetical protein
MLCIMGYEANLLQRYIRSRLPLLWFLELLRIMINPITIIININSKGKMH